MKTSTPIPDQPQRLQAIQPGQSFIVQAPAGSGKTGLLIQRYLKLLSLVDAPEEIVAITFTRKAAAEMQGRVLEALQLARAAATADNPHDQLTISLAGTALRHAAELGWDLTDNPGRVRIQTIDSLCGWLVRQMPVVSGLGGQPEVVEDPAPLYEQAATATLLELESGAEWSDSIARLLVHLDNDLPRLRDLLAEMLPKRDQWLRYVLAAHERRDLENSLIHLAEEKLAAVIVLFPADLEAELCRLLRYAGANLAAMDSTSAVAACREIAALPGTGAGDLPSWRGIADLLLTKGGTWRIRLDVKCGFPSPAGNKLESALRTEMKEAMKGLVTQLRDVAGLEQALSVIQQLPPPQFTDEEWDVINALSRLLGLSAAQLQLLFREQNRMDFTGISQAAVTALVTEEAPTDLALHLDYRIKHLLVDEFQDTSVNQLELLERLTAGWSGMDGHSLFLVGDPMQSIYRFREAEVANFIRTFHQQRLGQVVLQPLVLTANFRSEQGIVDWVNRGFAGILAGADDLTTGAVGFHPSTAVINNVTADHVRVYPFFNNAGGQEAAKIGEVIRTLRRDHPGDKIAILVRSRNHLVDILPALREAKVAYRAIEIESLSARPAIQDLLALTRAWLHPADRIAWLSVLRAPWCGLELKDLLNIAGDDRHRTIWESCRDDAVLQRLTKESRARLERVTSVFAEFLAQKQRRSVRAGIEALWCRLGAPATLLSDSDLQDVVTFLDLLETLDEGGDIADLQLLEEETAGLYAAPDNVAAEDSVQVMTIHKAKGLEFDHVILPGLGRWSRNTSSELLKWMLRTRADGGHDLFLAPIKQTGEKQSPIYDYIREVESSKDRHEQARLLYVAATRAKKTLHLSGSAQMKMEKGGELVCKADARSLLSHLWPTLHEAYENAMGKASGAGTGDAASATDTAIRRLTLDWSLPPPPIAVQRPLPVSDVDQNIQAVEFQWAGETIRHIGSVVHRCIQWIAKEGIDNWNEQKIQANRDQFVLMLRQACVPEPELKQAGAQVEAALLKMLSDDRGRWILAKDHAEPRSEYAISGLYQNHVVNVIIDRTFIDAEGVRWIVDYKTSRHEGADMESFLDREQERYAGQMHKYAALVQAMDDRTIKLGLYFPLLQGGWREWGYKS